jgi:HAD superfamily hydrolase (TIGR01509 family)
MMGWRRDLQAVVFDYGNTLVPFGPAEAAAIDRSLREELSHRYGPCDPDRLAALRREQVLRPYRDGYRESLIDDITHELVAVLYGRTADADALAALRAARREALLASVRPGPATTVVLARLAERYRLALLSNYPCGESIRTSLARLGLDRCFETVVVSADLGLVKPHRDLFDRVLTALDLPAAACVMVGDNWLADVQGARRRGLRAVLSTEYVSYEDFTPLPGDHEPDARIARLAELPDLLTG